MTNQRRQRRRVRRLRPAPTSAASALAADWAWELSSSGHLSVSRPELELALRGQVEKLLEALVGEPFLAQTGAEVGAYLVGLHATGAEALRRTLLLLAERLPGELSLSAEARRYRLTRLLVEIAAGWADAARQHPASAHQAASGDAPARRPGVHRLPKPPNPWFD